jgi:ABC-type lipoprotein export system ATPase subunit
MMVFSFLVDDLFHQELGQLLSNREHVDGRRQHFKFLCQDRTLVKKKTVQYNIEEHGWMLVLGFRFF